MFGALRSLASTLMQPVGQPFGQAPSPLRAVGLLLDSGRLQRHSLYLSRAGTRTHCVLALPAGPAPATCRRSRAPDRPKSARYLPAPAQ